ncbi:ParB/RepB/Spo0J family partition protein [Trichocoleus sp. FACHB-46]|nr:ParB/RepB/Spo0J family partition protein [Trichocoleus sp. FACHB-46]MBD1864284.1 ParB/RepB/Spo0J family partition protein [Trichocoleus sp. FACHB-46]
MGVDALFGTDEPEVAKQTISVSAIHLPAHQPRRYFDPQRMERLVDSVKEYGILENLLVRPLSSGQYELVAGERRYRAAKEAGLDEVPVTIRELTDDQALEIALIENLQREDLNPVEETEGVLQLLANRLGGTTNEAIAILNRKAYLDRTEGELDEVTENVFRNQWEVVEGVFAAVGKFTPESFRVSRLPLLKLPSDVLETLRQGQLEYTKARAIAGVKDDEQRQEILEEAIAQELSLSQIKERIKSLKPLPEESLKSRFDSTYKQVKKSGLWDDPRRRKQLEKLLAQMESLLAE